MTTNRRIPPRNAADIRRAIYQITEKVFPMPREELVGRVTDMESELIDYVWDVVSAIYAERPAADASHRPAVTPEAKCVTTYRAEAGDCDGPADRQVTYRSSRNHDKVLDTHGPLCNAHAAYEQRRARAAGQIADSTIDPYEPAQP